MLNYFRKFRREEIPEERILEIDRSDREESSELLTAVDNISRTIPAIEFRDVSIAFDEKVILNKVNFKVRRGETKIVLGRSGTGKSTIIRLILGLQKPDSGQILIDGEEIREIAPDLRVEDCENVDATANRNADERSKFPFTNMIPCRIRPASSCRTKFAKS